MRSHSVQRYSTSSTLVDDSPLRQNSKNELSANLPNLPSGAQTSEKISKKTRKSVLFSDNVNLGERYTNARKSIFPAPTSDLESDEDEVFEQSENNENFRLPKIFKSLGDN